MIAVKKVLPLYRHQRRSFGSYAFTLPSPFSNFWREFDIAAGVPAATNDLSCVGGSALLRTTENLMPKSTPLVPVTGSSSMYRLCRRIAQAFGYIVQGMADRMLCRAIRTLQVQFRLCVRGGARLRAYGNNFIGKAVKHSQRMQRVLNSEPGMELYNVAEHTPRSRERFCPFGCTPIRAVRGALNLGVWGFYCLQIGACTIPGHKQRASRSKRCPVARIRAAKAISAPRRPRQTVAGLAWALCAGRGTRHIRHCLRFPTSQSSSRAPPSI